MEDLMLGSPVVTPDFLQASSKPLNGAVSGVTPPNAPVVSPSFRPDLNRAVWLRVIATTEASGTITILRSTDGGATKYPTTSNGAITNKFTFSNVTGVAINEIVGAETIWDALWYVQIELTEGSVTYQLDQ
jgi:hypothetical protein